jgi:hypothetical protein
VFFLTSLACMIGYLLGAWAQRSIVEDEDERIEPAFAWRGINLAVGDGFKHVEACEELAALRAAGWHIEKQGNERGGFVYLKLIPPSAKQ